MLVINFQSRKEQDTAQKLHAISKKKKTDEVVLSVRNSVPSTNRYPYPESYYQGTIHSPNNALCFYCMNTTS